VELNTKPASWAKRTGLLAMVALTGACSDLGTEPSGLDSTDPRFNGGGGATQEPPPAVVLGLDPEQFTFQGPNNSVTSSNCIDAFNGTFSYSVSGIAFGTYEGTFTETGTVRVSGGIVQSLYVRFTIIGKSALDPDGRDYRIKGKKNLTTGLAGECLTVGPIIDPAVSGLLRYEATIFTPSGHRFSDRGTSQIAMASEQVGPAAVTTFDESFQSELLGGPTPCVEAEAGVSVGGLRPPYVEVEICPADLEL
jgi:hypothetical protein